MPAPPTAIARPPPSGSAKIFGIIIMTLLLWLRLTEMFGHVISIGGPIRKFVLSDILIIEWERGRESEFIGRQLVVRICKITVQIYVQSSKCNIN